MERKTRFELATLALARRCSTTEPLPLKLLFFLRASFSEELSSSTKRFTPNHRFGFSAYTTEPLPLKTLSIFSLRAMLNSFRALRALHSFTAAPYVYWLLAYAQDGAQRRNRTTDTGIFSPLLYRLSYLGIWRPGRDSNSRPPA